MEEWEGLFRGLDLWIDIKGSGVPYTEEARLDFQKALPRGCLSQVIDSTTELHYCFCCRNNFAKLLLRWKQYG